MRPLDEVRFMNFAYLSEKWLMKYLTSVKYLRPDLYSSVREIQRNDEIRHMTLCRDAILKTSDKIEESLEYSIQETLFKQIGGVDLNTFSNLEEMESTQLIVERRAVVAYKLYLKHGHNKLFKKMISEIIKDEKRHVLFNSPDTAKSERYLLLKKAEQFIFGKFLREKYGQKSFISPSFWDHLFEGSAFAKA